MRINTHSPEEKPMAVAALKLKPKLETFYATVHITRVEEWRVEAESEERESIPRAGGSGEQPSRSPWRVGEPKVSVSSCSRALGRLGHMPDANVRGKLGG